MIWIKVSAALVLLACTLLSGIAIGGYYFPLERTGEIPLKSMTSETGRIYSFSAVVRDTCHQQIYPFNQKIPSHRTLNELLLTAGAEISTTMSQPSAPVRKNRRINEASKHFEEALLEAIKGHKEFSCSIPETREGKEQRSGYPDLRIEHLTTGAIFYLDPKLFEESSKNSSFRTFYFEPGKAHKITEDAVHLVLGFPHDGKTRQWTYGKPVLVDLFKLRVRLKTEFSASNRDLYQ